MERKTKHLELIQGVVNRLASASFRMKGWAVVLTSGALIYLSAERLADSLLLLLAPVGAFWVLDGYFLWQERLFRKLYDKVRYLPEAEIDFSMETGTSSASDASWPMRLKGWARAVFSFTLSVFYGVLLGMVLVARWIA